jgi:hypothetical protein
MPLEVIKKPKTQSQPAAYMPVLVPLRVADILPTANEARAKGLAEMVQVGDLVFVIKDRQVYCNRVVLCKTGELLESWCNDLLYMVNAYDVKTIVVSNDDTPAPVV